MKNMIVVLLLLSDVFWGKGKKNNVMFGSNLQEIRWLGKRLLKESYDLFGNYFWKRVSEKCWDFLIDCNYS